jgi:hypothetical protein
MKIGSAAVKQRQTMHFDRLNDALIDDAVLGSHPHLNHHRHRHATNVCHEKLQGMKNFPKHPIVDYEVQDGNVVPNQRTSTDSNGNSNGGSHGSYKNNPPLSCDWLFEVADRFVDLPNLMATHRDMNGDDRGSDSSSSSPTQQPTVRLYQPIFLVEEIPEVQVDTFFTTRKSAPMIQLERGHSHRYMRTYSSGSASGSSSASRCRVLYE